MLCFILLLSFTSVSAFSIPAKLGQKLSSKLSHIDRRTYRRLLHEIKDNTSYLQTILCAEEDAMNKINDLIKDYEMDNYHNYHLCSHTKIDESNQ